jgi:hypothetical protein
MSRSGRECAALSAGPGAAAVARRPRGRRAARQSSARGARVAMAAATAPKNPFPHTWCVYGGLLALLLLQLLLSLGLFNYIGAVDRRLDARLDVHEEARRTKRAVGDENVVDEANVEFFHPNLRQELEEKDAARKASSSSKMSKDNKEENPWLYLTSYSRVPVSTKNIFLLGASFCGQSERVHLDL